MKTTKLINSISLFPFEVVPVHSSIAIYGAGNTGEQYVSQLLATNYAEIIAVVDENYEKIISFPFKVSSPKVLDCQNVEYVVISVQNLTVVEDITKLLLSYGFRKEQIVHSIIQVPVSERNLSPVLTEENLSSETERGRGLYEKLKLLKQSLAVFIPEEDDFIRVGKNNDGGYLMTTNEVLKKEGIAYSFGIAGDVSWDKEMADYGWDIYMYDHTIDRLPEKHERFHYYKEGISDTGENTDRLKTLSHFLEKNGHTNQQHMILKMDVEGAEYGFILNTDREDLRKFDEIVIEFHNLHNLEKNSNIEKALNKINDTHVVVHIHPNNYGNVIWLDGIPFPDVLEVTLLNKELLCFKELKNKTYLTHELDKPCWNAYKEIKIEQWKDL